MLYKKLTAIILIISLLSGCALAQRYTYPDKAYGGGYVKHYKPAEDMAIELVEKAGAVTQQEKFDVITKWLNKQIFYDYARQTRWRTLNGADIKRCFDRREGICMDIAALACRMFRTVGIKANVSFGFATWTLTMYTDMNGIRVYEIGKSWHAWCQVFIDGEEIIYDQDIGRRNHNMYKNIYTAEYELSHILK